MCSLFALLSALVPLVSANQVLGPSPPVVYVPFNGTAMFTCTYDDFVDNTDAWFWEVNGTEFDEIDHGDIVSGGEETSTLCTSVQQHSQQPVLVTCSIYRRQGKTYYFWANSTNFSLILSYGRKERDFSCCMA